MSKSGTVAAARDAPLFAWLGRLPASPNSAPPAIRAPVRRRLTIINVMALLIAIFSAVYAGVFAYYGVGHLYAADRRQSGCWWRSRCSRRSPTASTTSLRRCCIAVAEYVALFFFVRELGHNSGIQINYIIAAAVRLRHLRPVALPPRGRGDRCGLVLHLAAWFLFPPERAQIAADPALLANLYVSSAVTTFCIIALVVGYAFTVADHARRRSRRAARQYPARGDRRAAEGEAGRARRRQRRRSLRPVQRPRRLHRACPAAWRCAHRGAARRRSSPSSTGSRRRMAWRRSRPSATAIWRSPA